MDVRRGNWFFLRSFVKVSFANRQEKSHSVDEVLEVEMSEHMAIELRRAIRAMLVIALLLCPISGLAYHLEYASEWRAQAPRLFVDIHGYVGKELCVDWAEVNDIDIGAYSEEVMCGGSTSAASVSASAALNSLDLSFTLHGYQLEEDWGMGQASINIAYPMVIVRDPFDGPVVNIGIHGSS